jgi:uncharacterized protein
MKKFQKYVESVLKIKSSAHSIALGFSIGTLIGIFPTPGISFILGGIVVFLFKKVSKISLFGAILLWNPLVQLPIYWASYALGKILFKGQEIVTYDVSFFSILFAYTRRYLVGNAIIAITLSILSYYIVRKVADIYQKR